jgi:16S rRNA (cytosine1402-N4)-methyltransferase
VNSTTFDHEPVMVAEVIEVLTAGPAGTILDATVGGAGHATALLEQREDLRLVGLDRDPSAVEAAADRLAVFGDRAVVVHRRFDELDTALDALGIDRVAGVLFDLGVSSPQLDRGERGFSYRQSGPLDMRMDPTVGRDAAAIVNEADLEELRALLVAGGDERFARRIAAAIVAARPIGDTTELAEIVVTAIPAAARRGRHPARRTFQAIRIAVNDELAALSTALTMAIARLAPGGRGVVISYHSGEDRITKRILRDAETGGCECPSSLPCVCGAVPSVKLLGRRGRRPGDDEVARNRRSQSARLRAFERLAAA